MEKVKETELNIMKGLFLSPSDICKILGIGKKKCLELFHRDDFPSFIYGKTFLIEKSAFLNFFRVRNVILQDTEVNFE